MIQLTRLRHNEVLFLNPDLIERIDSHVDTVVRLTNGSEYLVSEPAETIVYRIAEFRARVLALVPVVSLDLPTDPDVADDTEGPGEHHASAALTASSTSGAAER